MLSKFVLSLLLALVGQQLAIRPLLAGWSHETTLQKPVSGTPKLLQQATSAMQSSGLGTKAPRVQQPTGNHTDPTPRGDRSSWFRQKDYPSEAKRNEQRGRVSITLQIDRKGVPRECRVTGSSGSPSLDQATCSLALDRARFYPARAVGKAVDGEYSLSTNWTLVQR